MAELGEYQRFLAEHRDGVVLADLCALATVAAAGLVYLGNRDTDLLALVKSWFQEEVGVGRFYVTIQEKRRRRPFHRQAERQAGCHSCFSGATLAAGNCNDHKLSVDLHSNIL
jgi:hypothetical protein